MRTIIGLDTETTGLKVDKGHRVIEFYGEVYRVADKTSLLTLESRFSNEGKAIDKKAEEVHGISAADLVGAPYFKSFAPKLDKVFQSVKAIVAHNAQFDVTFLAHHMAEAGYPLPDDLIIFDTMLEGMTASYDSKAPSLREFCWAMGVEYDTSLAHAASYDVQIMMKAFFVALDRGHFKLTAPETEKVAA